jgi:chorismate-pyruvate lyase
MKPTSVPPVALDSLFPLSEFYARTSLALPVFRPIEPHDMPEPYRTLLVHANDMTPTLERFHAGDISIRALSSEQRADGYFREVVLQRSRDEVPVEFGANCINLSLFTPEARWMILQEKVPLGRILRDHRIEHSTQVLGYFQIDPDEVILDALHLPAPVSLYGRRAMLCDPQERPLSQVVEILPLVSLTVTS